MPTSKAFPNFINNAAPGIDASYLNDLNDFVEMLVNEKINVTDKRWGAKPNGRIIQNASVSSGSATLTATGFTAAATAASVGDVITVEGAGAGGATLKTTVQSVTNNTTLVMAANSSATIAGSAVVAIGTGNAVAINAALAAASMGDIIYFPPGLYIVEAQLFSNTKGLRMQGGGRAFINDSASAAYQGGASLVCAMGSSNNLMVDQWFTNINHAGPEWVDIGFIDGTLNNKNNMIRVGQSTRWLFDRCTFAYSNFGLQPLSGPADTSWSLIHQCNFLFNTESMTTFNNYLGDPTGAMAIALWGGNFNQRANQIGLHQTGGAYWRYGGFKMDLDGNGVRGIVIDNSAGGNSSQHGHISYVDYEHSQPVNDTSYAIEVIGGAANLSLDHIAVAGGTSPPNPNHGKGIYIHGTSGNIAEKIYMSDIEVTNKGWGIHFGPYSRNCRARRVQMANIDVAYVQADANSDRCRVDDLDTDGSTDPLTGNNAVGGKFVLSAANSPWVGNHNWNTNGEAIPVFTGTIPSWFGQNGDVARIGTAMYMKTGAGWAAI